MVPMETMLSCIRTVVRVFRYFTTAIFHENTISIQHYPRRAIGDKVMQMSHVAGEDMVVTIRAFKEEVVS